MVNLQCRIFTSEIDIIEWDWNKFKPHLFINNCYNSCISVSIWVRPFHKKFKVSNTRALSLTPCITDGRRIAPTAASTRTASAPASTASSPTPTGSSGPVVFTVRWVVHLDVILKHNISCPGSVQLCEEEARPEHQLYSVLCNLCLVDTSHCHHCSQSQVV